jgi:group I intron endonuclease
VKSGIYKIYFNGSKNFYIGSSINIKNRIWRHKRDLKKGLHPNYILTRAFLKYGIDNLKYEILEYVPLNLLLIREQCYIDAFNPAYNICKTAGNTLGRKCKENTKLYLSNLFKNRYVSIETRIKHSLNMKNRIFSPHTKEWKEKISQSMIGDKNHFYGKKHTKESLLKIGLASKMRAGNIRRKRQVTITDNINKCSYLCANVTRCAKTLSLLLNKIIYRTSISAILRNKINKYKYLSNYDIYYTKGA